jgi:hypothetical protein
MVGIGIAQPIGQPLPLGLVPVGGSRRSNSRSARGGSAVTAISVSTQTPTRLSTASNRAPSSRCQRVGGGSAMTYLVNCGG